mmetsp:Transcript_71980/g.171858  ORF Transcript_71980/g.171858 Transcript_71980/m.171858 type:complete len:108 (-) Transcript_71980:1009-1332(-)
MRQGATSACGPPSPPELSIGTAKNFVRRNLDARALRVAADTASDDAASASSTAKASLKGSDAAKKLQRAGITLLHISGHKCPGTAVASANPLKVVACWTTISTVGFL